MSEDPRLERWLEALVLTPGLSGVRTLPEARLLHVDEPLAALSLIAEGPVCDVGSGGGSPGLPLAARLPSVRFDLLEPSRRKCEFLRIAAAGMPNVRIVGARAEIYGRAEGRDLYAVALARALAPPPVAVEWCLPLVRPGGRLVLFAGETDDRVERVATALSAELVEAIPMPGTDRRQLLVFEKLAPTPASFPRRPGIARKRPLA